MSDQRGDGAAESYGNKPDTHGVGNLVCVGAGDDAGRTAGMPGLRRAQRAQVDVFTAAGAMIDISSIQTQGTRSRQEDAYTVWGQGVAGGPVVFAVADGLGGHPNGDKASKAVIGALCEAMAMSHMPGPRGPQKAPVGAVLPYDDAAAAEHVFDVCHNAALAAEGSTTLLVTQITPVTGRRPTGSGVAPLRANFWWAGDCTALVLRKTCHAPTYTIAYATPRHGVHNYVSRFLGVTSHAWEQLEIAKADGLKGWWAPAVAYGDLLPGDIVIAMTDGFDDVFGFEAGTPKGTLQTTLRTLYKRRQEPAADLCAALERWTRRLGATDNATMWLCKIGEAKADAGGGLP